MKKKKRRTLLLLCGFLVVLSGAYAALMGYNRREDSAGEENTSAENAVQILALEGTVTEMTVTSGLDTMEFVLQDELWSEKNHPGYVMKQSPLVSMAGVFSNLSASHTIAADTQNLGEYGLDNPQYILRAKNADGQETVLYVGMKNTVTTEYYVYTDSVPGVYTVGTTAINYFARNLMDFAEIPAFPKIEEGSFQSLALRNGEENLKAEMLTESAYDMSGILTWYVTEPFEHEYVAHTTTLDTIFTAIEGLTYNRAAAYQPDEAELAGMGLAEPVKELAFTYKQADTETASEEVYSYRLYIGNEDGNGYFYVLPEDSDLVLLMSKESLEPLFAYTAGELVNKYFALINIDSVDSIEMVLDDGSAYTLNPPDSEADDEKAEAQKDLYQTIISIHAEKVIDAGNGNGKLLPLSMKFHRNAEPSLVEIQFAEYDTSYYLAIVDGEGIYLVNKRDYNQYCEDVKAGFEGLSE